MLRAGSVQNGMISVAIVKERNREENKSNQRCARVGRGGGGCELLGGWVLKYSKMHSPPQVYK